MIECRRNAPFCLPSPGVASRLYASPGPLQPVKQPSDSHPPKKSLLGRLANGLKRLLGDTSAGTPAAASPPPPARSKKDLFPDEKFEPGEGSGRESRDGAGRGGRARTGRPPGGDERPVGAGAAGGRPADGRVVRPGTAGAADARPPREPRPPREGPPREGPPREPRPPREGGGPRDQRSGEGGDRFVRAERSGRTDDRGPARSEVDGVVAVGGVTAVMAARRVTVIRKKVVVPASRCRLRGRPQSRRPSRWDPFRKPLRRLASRRVFSAAFATWGTARRLLFRKKAFLWRSKDVT